MNHHEAKREIADSLERYFSERLISGLSEHEKEAQTNKAFHLSGKQFVYCCTLLGHEPQKPMDTQGQCHYCGVTITEKNYQLREVRTVNELGDYEPCCDDCAKATSKKRDTNENT